MRASGNKILNMEEQFSQMKTENYRNAFSKMTNKLKMNIYALQIKPKKIIFLNM